MSNQRLMIIGGTGYVGKNLVKKLTRDGHQILLPVRNSKVPKKIENNLLVKTMEVPDLSAKSLGQLMSLLGSQDVVINLVGVLHSSTGTPYGKEFKEAHVDITSEIVKAMEAVGLKRYLHMSALGANSKGPSMYLRSKGDAEAMVRSSTLDWTIFRPSVIFGQNDNFINMFAKLQKYLPFMPLANAKALFQPVAIGDVSSAFMKAIDLSETIRQSYDLGGPKVYTLEEIVKFAAKKAGFSRCVIGLPNWAAYFQAYMLEKMPGPTLMSRDNLMSMKVPNVLLVNEPNCLESVFKLTPTPLESLIE